LESNELKCNSLEAKRDFISIEIPDNGGLVAVNGSGLPQIVDTSRYGADNIFVFQPFWNTYASHLLMVCPGRSRPLINAMPAPPIALLTVKDEILFPNASEWVAHVSIYSRPRLGPAPENRIGRKCPICRSKLSKKTNTYTCYQCGQVLHYKAGRNSRSVSLDCANICNSCPVCRAKIYLNDGYVYLPDSLQKKRKMIGMKEILLSHNVPAPELPVLGARLPNIINAPFDADLILSDVKLAVVGCGAIGRSVALHFARLKIRKLWLIDKKK